MNRRRLLQSAGVVSLVGLAGCIDGVREHFTGSVRTNAPVEVFNAGDYPFNVELRAREAGTGRETYDLSINLIPGERAAPQNIQRTDQSLSITRHGESSGSDGAEEDLVEQARVTEDTQLVLVHFHNDSIDLDVIESQSEAEAEREELEEEANETSDGEQD